MISQSLLKMSTTNSEDDYIKKSKWLITPHLTDRHLTDRLNVRFILVSTDIWPILWKFHFPSVYRSNVWKQIFVQTSDRLSLDGFCQLGFRLLNEMENINSWLNNIWLEVFSLLTFWIWSARSNLNLRFKQAMAYLCHTHCFIEKKKCENCWSNVGLHVK